MMAGTPFSLQDNAAFQGDVALAWTYFHRALPAWAIYCIVSLFLSYSRHNMKRDNTFRGSVENPFKNRTIGIGVGIVVVLMAIQFFKWVRHDEQLVERGEAEPFPEDSREHQEYLQWLENIPKKEEAAEAEVAKAVEAE